MSTHSSLLCVGVVPCPVDLKNQAFTARPWSSSQIRYCTSLYVLLVAFGLDNHVDGIPDRPTILTRRLGHDSRLSISKIRRSELRSHSILMHGARQSLNVHLSESKEGGNCDSLFPSPSSLPGTLIYCNTPYVDSIVDFRDKKGTIRQSHIRIHARKLAELSGKVGQTLGLCFPMSSLLHTVVRLSCYLSCLFLVSFVIPKH